MIFRLTKLLVVIAVGGGVAFVVPVGAQTLKKNQTRQIILRTESPR